VIDVPVDYRDNLRRLGGDLLADVLLWRTPASGIHLPSSRKDRA
jgi:hypothetical protein